mmetsp:Transcript_32340/g.83949  ORF Transcript_32340/g.83949 Transcript_32340/m.83949 type:complete len:984 (+) Transcript_32340:25-2976(+)
MAEDWCAAATRRVKHGSDGVWLRFGPPVDESFMSKMFSIRFNPVTSGAATVMLFGFVIVLLAIGVDREGCLVEVDGKFTGSACFTPRIEFQFWMKWVTDCFTWLYIGSQDCWVIFLAVLYFSRFGNMKLGKDDDEPEFSNFSWFAMIFSCGVGVGLFFYGVAEPIFHYTGGNRYGHAWGDLPHRLPDNERAQAAMNLTWFHWGVHGWVVYAIVGILLAFLHYRKGLPMTIKSCFYPLIGERIYGFWGDFVDSMSIVATTMGVCTSLGLGVFQINAGIKKLTGYPNWIKLSYYNEANLPDWSDRLDSLRELYEDYPLTGDFRLANSWYVNGNASLGVNIGTASQIASFVDTNDEQILIIWLITLTATASVVSGLQVGIQTLSMICLYLGMFLMMIILLMDDTWYIMNLYTQSLGYYFWDFFRISAYSGAFAQGDHSAPEGENPLYMNWWTIFYWGWWIAFAPFVGIFFARISKGRTVRQFLNGTMTLPIAYNFAWMAVFGGAGLKMEMLADKYGVTCETPLARSNICREVERMRPSGYGGNPEVFCSAVTKLSCRGTTDMIFDVLYQYADLGPFLGMVCLVSLILYFITSSDSGSLVDDIVSANGIPEPPIVQRIYWAFTEGLAATALLYQGRLNIDDPQAGLTALQSASICVGLPYTFLICFMCVALWRALQYETGELQWSGKQFRSSVLDVGITAYGAGEGTTRCFNLRRGTMDTRRFGKFGLYAVCPVIPFLSIHSKLQARKADGKASGVCSPAVWTMVNVAAAGLLFYLWLILIIVDNVDTAQDGYIKFGNEIEGGQWNSTGQAWTFNNASVHRVSQRYGMYQRYPGGDMAAGHEVPDVTSLLEGHADFYPQYFQAGAELAAAGVAAGAVGDRIGSPLHYAVIGWYLYFTFVTLVMSLRNQVRTLFQYGGNIVEDFFAALFLYPTVLIQVEEALCNAKVDISHTNEVEVISTPPPEKKPDPVEAAVVPEKEEAQEQGGGD